ncbi:hypothetical protein HOE04_01880 [archaeon]|jgi:hypothetical protein|nr:hypothetical protein [archaeon]
MEDSQEKLDLMMKCYLGKFHPALGCELQINSWGFGNNMQGLLSCSENYLYHPTETIWTFKMGKFYQRAQSAYDSFPFDKLDPEDKDFKILFEVKDELQKLGNALETLIESTDPTYFREVSALIKNTIRLVEPDYRNAVKDLWYKLNQKQS